MESLREKLSSIVSEAFAAQGLSRQYGGVVPSNRADLCQFQCNGALAAAGQHDASPREIAQQVVDALADSAILDSVALAGPGFINLTLTDRALAEHVQEMALDDRLGCSRASAPLQIVIDYGGPNIAKPLHVGHLRSAIIGESLKRLGRFLGHTVLGDVHLGDWGLQMGMIISEIERRQPDLPYFDAAHTGPYPVPAEPPVTIQELEEMYPLVSERAGKEPAVMEAARQATYELQQGHPGYRALWEQIRDVSVADLESDYARLNVVFDLWLGESDAQERIPGLVERVQAGGWAHESAGAMVIDVTEPDDRNEIPPLILTKSDGAALYSTTDLATIEQRVQDYAPDLILYVVDSRQSGHFCQVFRAARKTGIAPAALKLEHVGFGTMNGKDGKPFKTRAGGVLRLKDLIQTVADRALEQMVQVGVSQDQDETDRAEIVRVVSLAALKFADLRNHPTKNYVFDLDRFASFDGYTGSYLLYAAVRIKSILRKAADEGLEPGALVPPVDDTERSLLLKIAELPDVLNLAFENRAPNTLCEYAHGVASTFTRFYDQHHILREPDAARQASWLALSRLSLAVLELAADLLGIEIPEKM